MKTLFTFLYAICIAGILTIGSLLLLTVFPIPGLDLDARVVQSGSMEPVIKTGSIVFIRPAEEYKVDDIITYHRGKEETPTTHRIVEVKKVGGKTLFVTKGDANSTIDMEMVPEENVIGSVRIHIPFIGYAIAFAREPLGFILLIIVPASLIAIDEVKNMVKEIKRRKSDRNKVYDQNKKTKPVVSRKRVIDIVNVQKK